ncbi:MAG: protein phosphatase CheZ [Magnetospirillum sp.]|nr:protein phosphatase CheZ [Magnetospirillum sp.]
MSSDRRLFTAEIQRMKQLASKGESGSGVAPAEVMRALNEIKGELRVLTALAKGEEVPSPNAGAPDAEEVMQQKQAEVSMLKTELRALAVCIEQTKTEIAALKPADSDDDRLMAVAFELDAIVSSTEGATETILEAAEKIENLTREIQSHGSDNYIYRLAEDINETIISVYEACNFQDITGQRITKVVRTLKYVEARIMAMIDIWGPDNIAEIIPRAADDHRDDESKLLNGPQLENKGISQDEIDKLFG